MEEEIFGYRFGRPELLEEALTTPAYRMQVPSAKDNQRLEFLGDAVLGLLSADRVYAEFPDQKEGALTVKRTHMVSSAALCAAAMRLGLRERLRRNRGAETLPPDSKTLADAVEAVLGAAWLDGGFPAVKIVFEALALTANADLPEWSDNPKGELQVRAQALQPPVLPAYRLISTSGKAHQPIFTVEVSVPGIGVERAEAGSHRQAERLAAARLLARMG